MASEVGQYKVRTTGTIEGELDMTVWKKDEGTSSPNLLIECHLTPTKELEGYPDGLQFVIEGNQGHWKDFIATMQQQYQPA